MNRYFAAYAGTATVMVAVLFYVLCAVGVVVFAVAPQLAPASPRGWAETLGMAALFGFIAYSH